MSIAIIVTVSVARVTSVPLCPRLTFFLNKKERSGVDASEPGDYAVSTVATTLYVPSSVTVRPQSRLPLDVPSDVA